MKIQNEQVNDDAFFNQSRDEICGNISSFWIKTSPHWHELKAILSECNEMEAVVHVKLMEIYNREGRFEGQQIL